MPLVHRMQPFASTVFAEMSALALQHDAVNLGQGFPDTDGPRSMLLAAQRAIADGRNQYPPGVGVPELRQAVADHQRLHYGLDYDPDTQVLVTAGATEAIAGAVLGLVEPGDEVLMLEPYYDAYAATVALAGGVRATVSLHPGADGFHLDLDELAAAFTPRTRVLLLNSPHNPTGTVLSDEELRAIADLAIAHDVTVISDEVYEHLLFDGRRHTPIATLPGMSERTLRISSAAKTFNVTGWKVGWLSGPEELVAAARAAKQYLTYVASGPFQPAVALALREEMDWVAQSAQALSERRTALSDVLRSSGFDVYPSQSTYFVLADPRPLGFDDGVAFCRHMLAEIGVAAVPVAAFVDHHDRWDHLVRFAFAKQPGVIDEASRRLARL